MAELIKKGEAKCKSCGAPIIWITDQNGQRLPVNKTRVRIYGETGDGWVFAEHLGKPRLVHVSHFVSCPNATKHSMGGQPNTRARKVREKMARARDILTEHQESRRCPECPQYRESILHGDRWRCASCGQTGLVRDLPRKRKY